MATEADMINAFFLEAFEPRHRLDPYPLYRRLREVDGLLSSEVEMHLALGHEVCWSLLRHPSASSDERNGVLFRREAATDQRLAALMDTRPLLVFMDPPDHTRLRSLVAQGFTPRRVARLRGDIERRTRDLIEEMSQWGDVDVDLVEQLALPLPLGVICDLLGVPSSDHQLFRDWSAALVKLVEPGVLLSDDDRSAIAAAADALRSYASAQLTEHRAHPTDGLLSDLAPHLDDGPEAADELADLVLLLLVAGHETTVHLIGNAVVALLSHPDQLDDWHHHPELTPNAVDELLRYDAPLQMVQRVATADLDLGGRTVAVGDQVIVMLGAANRDPAVFPDPDRLDLRRPNASRHLAFGGGIHHCLGAALARAEGEAILGALVRHFPDMEPAGEAPVRPLFNLRGRTTVPVRLGAYR